MFGSFPLNVHCFGFYAQDQSGIITITSGKYCSVLEAFISMGHLRNLFAYKTDNIKNASQKLSFEKFDFRILANRLKSKRQPLLRYEKSKGKNLSMDFESKG